MIFFLLRPGAEQEEQHERGQVRPERVRDVELGTGEFGERVDRPEEAHRSQQQHEQREHDDEDGAQTGTGIANEVQHEILRLLVREGGRSPRPTTRPRRPWACGPCAPSA